MLLDPDQPVPWICTPPDVPQSLSPFESRTTTLVVLWSTLLVSCLLLVICWTLFA